METIRKQKFNMRAFVSISMFVSLAGLPVSGIMNHNLQLELLGQKRHFWMSIHNMSALLFTISALIHIILNWRSLVNYIKRAKTNTIKKEAIFAFILIVVIVGLFSSHVFHIH